MFTTTIIIVRLNFIKQSDWEIIHMKTRFEKAVLTAVLFAAGLTASAAAAERVLRIDEAPIGELDPAKASDYADSVLAINLYDTLVYPKQGGAGVQPHLASDWSVDGNVFTFTLRDDVTFNSGNPLTAEDVVFSYNRMIALGQGQSGLFAGRIASVEATDTNTVVFTLTEPFAPFLASLVRLSVVDSKVVSEHFAEGDHGDFGDYGSEWLSQNSAGSGAYVAETHDPQTETVLVADTDYFLGFDENYPEKVRYRYGLDPATVRALISTGEHDVSSQWLPPEVYGALAAEGSANLVSEGGLAGEYIQFNTRRAPLDDVHCRRALSYAFDYDTLLNLVKINDGVSQGFPMNGPLPTGLLGRDNDAPGFVQDMAKAQEQLALCKYGEGERALEISWIAETPARERGALLMQSLYGQLGFDVTITRVPWVLFTEQLVDPDTAPHIAEIAINAATPDTDALLYNMYSSANPATWMSTSYLVDDQVDALLTSGRTETDPDKRAEIYAELNNRLIDLAPGIFGYELRSVFAVRDGVEMPNLSDPARAYPLSGFGTLFKDVQING